VCALIRVDLRFYRACVPQPVGGHSIVELEADRRFLRQLGDLSYLPRELRARAREPLTLTPSLLVAPQAGGDLVGVEEAGVGQAQPGFVEGEPAGL
jgi:hypothetical protein